jgi:hypothetical protein
VTDDDDSRHIYLTPVRAEHADEFERWLGSTLLAAVRKVQPEQEQRQQVLRATEERDGLVYFAFVLAGGDASEWQIDPLLRQAFGDEAAEREGEAWNRMVAGEQTGATFRPVVQL